jgi:hypothetical protein
MLGVAQHSNRRNHLNGCDFYLNVLNGLNVGGGPTFKSFKWFL